MKKHFIVCFWVLSISLTACSLFTKKNANSALDAAQLACIFNETVTNEDTLADICGVSKDLIPVIRNLVAQREAALKAGAPRWGHPYRDAGVPLDAEVK